MGDSQGIATKDLLKALTGLQRPSAVCRWLDGEKIPYIIGADHWPRVLGSIIAERMGGAVPQTSPEPQLRLRHG